MHYKNVASSPFTTIAGLVLLISSVVSIFIPSLEVTWADIIPVLPITVLLLGAKDPAKQ